MAWSAARSDAASRHLPASMRPDGRGPFAEGCILLVISLWPSGCMAVASSRKDASMGPLASLHEAAWPQASRPRARAFCLLACHHEASWMSAITAWLHPSSALATSFRPYGCAPRPERCILFVIADIDHAQWVHPLRPMDVPLRRRRSPIDDEGGSHPVTAGTSPSEAVTDHG